MQKNISSDKPVLTINEDRFQRYEFSKRIAERIIDSDNNDSIVIGIYGAWGEGKTSSINFIEEELIKDKSIIPIRFNPWRFTEEATLLVSFFNTLATEIKKSLPTQSNPKNDRFLPRKLIQLKQKWLDKKEPLKTNKETIGELIEKYGRIVSIFGAGEAAESIGKVLSNVDIGTIKERFERMLVESNKKLVIFIDDIDRLDKQEVHAIFRLVKLTADFSNTFYILSFDQEMVASAIGERFGEGGKQAGMDFLEKIIQVPLKIPVAQPDALKKFCFELVDKSINESGIDLTQEEVQRYISEFSENVLIRLKTPRLAVRYGNTLSFSFPLLKGEVNTVDLMLIEALKIFYPKYYEFVKEHSHFFLNSYDTQSSYRNSGDIESKKKELSEYLELLGHGFSKRERESVKSLLTELFPRLNEAFNNTFYHNGHIGWFKEKRIVSPEYFKRYFSYTVLKGELSDVAFESILSSIDKSSEVEIISKIRHLIESSSIDNFLHKIRSKEEDFPWEISKKIALCIALLGDLFKENYSVFSFSSQSAKSQAAIFIYQLIKKHENNTECFSLAKELMHRASPFDFAYEINNWLRLGKTEEEKIFSSEQYQELGKILFERALNDSGVEPIFIKYPDNVYYLFEVWKEVNEKSLNDYIKSKLDLNPTYVLDLLKAFTPVMRSSAHPEPYKSNFKKEQYDHFINLFQKEFIYKHIMNFYEEQVKEAEVVFHDMEDTQSDINILRQFIYWFEKDK